MNILVICNHYAVASGRYIADAFRRLGHEVKHIGQPMGREIWGLTLPPGSEWTPDNETFLITQWRPDLIIVTDTDRTCLNQGVSASELSGAPLVCWTVDNHVRDVRTNGINHYFLAHRNVSVMDWIYDVQLKSGAGGLYGVVKGTDMTHLPCAYDPTQHTPSPIPYAERAYDVAILGYMYPQRLAAVKALQAAGLKVIWGCGLVGEAYRDAHHNSRIALSLSFNGDVGCRVFETAAMGCVVMSDACADFDILKPDGIWIIESGKPLAEQVQAILDQPAVAELSIAKSMAWVQSGNRWDDRAQVIVDWYQEQYSGEKVLA